jgi:tyrosyl-tRNA synthetase
MKLYTEIPVDEIDNFSHLDGKELNELKKRLADEATSLCHDYESAKKARKTSEDTFEKGLSTEDLPIHNISEDTPLYKILVDTFLASSNSEARKLIIGKGVKLDGVLVSDERFILKAQGIETIKLSVGKKKHIVLKFN